MTDKPSYRMNEKGKRTTRLQYDPVYCTLQGWLNKKDSASPHTQRALQTVTKTETKQWCSSFSKTILRSARDVIIKTDPLSSTLTNKIHGLLWCLNPPRCITVPFLRYPSWYQHTVIKLTFDLPRLTPDILISKESTELGYTDMTEYSLPSFMHGCTLEISYWTTCV